MKKTIFKSSDTNVMKFVFQGNGIAVEAVLYRYGSFRKRTVICCSTQCGCPVGCTFCGTGRHFIRSLSASEIVEQVHHVLSEIDCSTNDIEKFQIMFMSMGEPFLNYKQVSLAISQLSEEYPNAQLLVSTSAPSGMQSHMEEFTRLSRETEKIGIQFSVHESTDVARGKLIPTNPLPLAQVAAIGEGWAEATGRHPFYNYCVHIGNNSEADADRLVQLFRPWIWETTLSVICESDESVKASIDRQLQIIADFRNKLESRGASVRVFNPAGQDDIGGGCGQLWFFQKWMKDQKSKASEEE